MQVAADSRRSTDLIQAIRVPVGRGVVAAVGAGAGAGPMYLLDPDLGRRRHARIVVRRN
jgi:hypothetical protein